MLPRDRPRHHVPMTRLGLRIAVLLCLPLALTTGLATPPATAAAPVPTAAPASLDLHWLLGDENEPDENEPDDDDTQAQTQRGADRDTSGDDDEEGDDSSWSRQAAIGVAGLALALVAGATLVIIRWIRRFRAWTRRVTLRTQALTRRLSDELDRAWRR